MTTLQMKEDRSFSVHISTVIEAIYNKINKLENSREELLNEIDELVKDKVEAITLLCILYREPDNMELSNKAVKIRYMVERINSISHQLSMLVRDAEMFQHSKANSGTSFVTITPDLGNLYGI